MSNDRYSINQTYQERKRLISAYDDFITEKMENGAGEFYYINFMFNHLPGGRSAKIEQMSKQVTRFHDVLTNHIVRKRTSFIWRTLVPRIFAVPDLPVWKHVKVPIRTFQVNGGLHFNAIAILPRRFRSSRKRKYPNLQQSRLRVSLTEHVKTKPQLYLTSKLYRIDVKPITHDTMTDYTFKTFKNGYVSSDDILILS